jgi:hypothetical protein
MTVRAKSNLSRALSGAAKVKAIMAKSNVVGELQVQVVGLEGKLITVFIPSSAGRAEPRLVNLLDSATAAEWKKSRSLLAAVRIGHLTVTLIKE